MKRNTSLIASSIITILIVTVILGVNLMSNVLIQKGSPETSSAVKKSVGTAISTAEAAVGSAQAFQPQSTTMDKQYQQQIEGLTQTLEKLDADYGVQLQILQDQLVVAEQKNAGLDAQVATAQATVDELQTTLNASDSASKTELATWTAVAQREEAALQAQLESLQTDLQSAYAQVAAKQQTVAVTAGAGAASYTPPPANNTGGNTGGGSSVGNTGEEDDDDHDDD